MYRFVNRNDDAGRNRRGIFLESRAEKRERGVVSFYLAK